MISSSTRPGPARSSSDTRRARAEFLDVAQRLRERHDAETERIQRGVPTRSSTSSAPSPTRATASSSSSSPGASARARASDEHARRHRQGRPQPRADRSAGMSWRRKIAPSARGASSTTSCPSRRPSRARSTGSGVDGAWHAIAITVRAGSRPSSSSCSQNEELFCDYDARRLPGPGRRAPAARTRGALRLARVRHDRPTGARARRRPRGRAPGCTSWPGSICSGERSDDHFLGRAHRCCGATGSSQDARECMKDDVVRARRDAAARTARRPRAARSAFSRSSTAPAAMRRSRAELALIPAGRSSTDTRPIHGSRTCGRRSSSTLPRCCGALSEYSADFAALQELEARHGAFSREETRELRALLGMYGTDAAPAARRCGDSRTASRARCAGG